MMNIPFSQPKIIFRMQITIQIHQEHFINYELNISLVISSEARNTRNISPVMLLQKKNTSLPDYSNQANQDACKKKLLQSMTSSRQKFHWIKERNNVHILKQADLCKVDLGTIKAILKQAAQVPITITYINEANLCPIKQSMYQ